MGFAELIDRALFDITDQFEGYLAYKIDSLGDRIDDMDTEIEKAKLEDRRVLAIPLSRLRKSVGEIPGDKEIICYCQLGMRSYEACRTLEGSGFGNVKFLEGGFRFWSEVNDSGS